MKATTPLPATRRRRQSPKPPRRLLGKRPRRRQLGEETTTTAAEETTTTAAADEPFTIAIVAPSASNDLAFTQSIVDAVALVFRSTRQHHRRDHRRHVRRRGRRSRDSWRMPSREPTWSSRMARSTAVRCRRSPRTSRTRRLPGARQPTPSGCQMSSPTRPRPMRVAT